MQKSSFLVYFTLTQLYRQRVHLGVSNNIMNSIALRYLLPIKSKFSIMNLNYTITLFKLSFNYLLYTLMNRGNILLINESKSLVHFLRESFDSLNQPVSYENWSSGLLSNFKAVRRNSLKTYFLKKQFILTLFKLDLLGLLNSKTRNVIKSSFNFLKFKKELNRYIKNLNRMPNVVFTFDSLLSNIAIYEAKLMGVISVGICDSNVNNFNLNYAIPGNSTSISSLFFYIKLLRLIFLKGLLLERRNFLQLSLNNKKKFMGLNFLLSNFLNKGLVNNNYNLIKFKDYFLSSKKVLNPFLNFYLSNLFIYKRNNYYNSFYINLNKFNVEVVMQSRSNFLSNLKNYNNKLNYLYTKAFKKVDTLDLLKNINFYLYARRSNYSIISFNGFFYYEGIESNINIIRPNFSIKLYIERFKVFSYFILHFSKYYPSLVNDLVQSNINLLNNRFNALDYMGPLLDKNNNLRELSNIKKFSIRYPLHLNVASIAF